MNELLKLLRSQRFLLTLVAVSLGVVATFLVQAYVSRSINAISGGALIPIVAAANSIAAGQAIKESDLAIRSMPSTYVHVRAVPAENMKLLVGQQANVQIQQGQAILWTEIALPPQGGLSDMLRVNERAVTIKVDQTSTFSGMIQPGDRVDVMNISRAGGLAGNSSLKVLIQSALVIAVDDHTRPPALGPGGDSPAVPGSKSPGTVTLRLSAEDAPRVAWAASQGRIVLVLRNRSDIFTTTVPDVVGDEAAAPSGASSSPLAEHVPNYPMIYEDGKKVASGYYPPPSMAPDELRQLSPEQLRERILDYTADRAASRNADAKQ